jgi:hypothetical protein
LKNSEASIVKLVRSEVVKRERKRTVVARKTKGKEKSRFASKMLIADSFRGTMW